VEAVFAGGGSTSGFVLLLLGKFELVLAQTSSPVMLPDWFPVAGGQIVELVVEDLTWSADGPLNCAEVRMGEICGALYNLEGVLIRRLQSAHEARHQSGNAFMDVIRKSPAERYADLLADFEVSHRSQRSAEGFRPSLRESSSLVSRIWAVAQSHNLDGLLRPGKALAAALGLEEDFAGGAESLVAVLSRPSTRDATPAHRFSRGLIVTVSSACQFVTAAAHAAEYSRYPIPLLVAFSFDLRVSLSAAETGLGMR
jgi:hypothetical protein